MPIPATRTSFSSLFSMPQGLMADLAQRTVDMTRQIGELNLHLAHQLLLDASDASHQLLHVATPTQALAFTLQASRPVLDHIRTYQNALASLLTGLHAPSEGGAGERAGSAARGSNMASGTPPATASRADDAAAAAGYSRLH